MPLYEYRCESCGETFEKMVAFSQANGSPEGLPECPHCHGSQTRKQISTFATRSASTATSASASCGSGGGRFT